MAAAAFSLYDLVISLFELEAVEVFCGFFFWFWSGFSWVRNRNEEAI